jgi:hypothetical protein
MIGDGQRGQADDVLAAASNGSSAPGRRELRSMHEHDPDRGPAIGASGGSKDARQETMVSASNLRRWGRASGWFCSKQSTVSECPDASRKPGERKKGTRRSLETACDRNRMCRQACRRGASARRSHGVQKHPRRTYCRRFRDRILRRTAAGGLIRFTTERRPGLQTRRGAQEAHPCVVRGLKPALWIAKRAGDSG